MITITDDMLSAAIDRVIGEVLTPEAISDRVQREIEKRTATMSLEEAADANGWTKAEFKKLLRRNGIKVIALSCRNFRVRVTDIEQLQDDHKRPLGTAKRKRPKVTPFPKAA